MGPKGTFGRPTRVFNHFRMRKVRGPFSGDPHDKDLNALGSLWGPYYLKLLRAP